MAEPDICVSFTRPSIYIAVCVWGGKVVEGSEDRAVLCSQGPISNLQCSCLLGMCHHTRLITCQRFKPLKKKVWWSKPVIPATGETEAGRLKVQILTRLWRKFKGSLRHLREPLSQEAEHSARDVAQGYSTCLAPTRP